MTLPIPLTVSVTVYLIAMLSEHAIARSSNQRLHNRRDVRQNLTLGVMSVVPDVVAALLWLPLLALVADHALFDLEVTVPLVVAAFVLDDALYYWFHRSHHRIRVLWAIHVVHHSSTQMNLTVAVRQPLFSAFTKPAFWLPSVLLGVPVELILAIQSVSLAYQFFMHTRMGRHHPVVERVMITPALHRLHHAANPGYIDCNFGAVLSVWDRLFGTLRTEVHEPVYGIGRPCDTLVEAVFGEWRRLVGDVRRAPDLRTRIAVVAGLGAPS